MLMKFKIFLKKLISFVSFKYIDALMVYFQMGWLKEFHKPSLHSLVPCKNQQMTKCPIKTTMGIFR